MDPTGPEWNNLLRFELAKIKEMVPYMAKLPYPKSAKSTHMVVDENRFDNLNAEFAGFEHTIAFHTNPKKWGANYNLDDPSNHGLDPYGKPPKKLMAPAEILPKTGTGTRDPFANMRQNQPQNVQKVQDLHKKMQQKMKGGQIDGFRNAMLKTVEVIELLKDRINVASAAVLALPTFKGQLYVDDEGQVPLIKSYVSMILELTDALGIPRDRIDMATDRVQYGRPYAIKWTDYVSFALAVFNIGTDLTAAASVGIVGFAVMYVLDALFGFLMYVRIFKKLRQGLEYSLEDLTFLEIFEDLPDGVLACVLAAQFSGNSDQVSGVLLSAAGSVASGVWHIVDHSKRPRSKRPWMSVVAGLSIALNGIAFGFLAGRVFGDPIED